MRRTKNNTISEIALAYKPGLELEIRFRLNQLAFETLYKLILAESSTQVLVESISVIMESNTDTFRRKEVFFRNNERTSEEYIEKKPIRARWNNELDYKIILSEEKVIPKFELINCKLIRVKLRESLLVQSGAGNWQYDFTYIRVLDCKQINELTAIRNQIFPTKPLKSSDFLDYIQKMGTPSMFVNFELEIEYKGPESKASPKVSPEQLEADMNAIIEKITLNNSGPETTIKPGPDNYHKYLYGIAKLVLSDQPHAADLYRNNLALKQLVNQPISFDQETWNSTILPKIDQYYLSDKADGDRALLWIQPKPESPDSGPNQGSSWRVILVTSKDAINITEISVKSGMLVEDLANTILDVEVLGLSGSGFDRIYAFDVLYSGTKTTQKPMHERDVILEKICTKTGKLIQKKIQVRLTGPVSTGTEDPDSYYQTQIRHVFNRKSRLYEIDGLIFTPDFNDMKHIKYTKPEDYFDMVVYKWKPPEKVTIDFLVMKAPESLIGIKPYDNKPGHTLYLLFSGIKIGMFQMLNLKYMPEYRTIFSNIRTRRDYFPIQFSPSIDPRAYLYYHPDNYQLSGKQIEESDLHKHVAEFRYVLLNDLSPDDKSFSNWRLERLRPDKDILVEKGINFGNDFKVAEETFNYYRNPFTLEQLIGSNSSKSGLITSDEKSGGDDSYFTTVKRDMYKPMTKFNLFVKAQVLRQLEGSDWIIDLASGKGQDLIVYNGFRIKNGIFLEIDKTALEELTKRKYQFDDIKLYKFNKKPATNMNVFVDNVDLRQDYQTTVATIRKFYTVPNNAPFGDAVVINFALHYLIDSGPELNNFVELVDAILKPGGLFIFTAFNGAKIFELLRNIPEGKSWDVFEKAVLKYSIRKLYKSGPDVKMAKFGQKISVLHPFSAGKYYEENLLNIDSVLEAFAARSYIVRQNSSFGDWLDKYRIFNKELYDSMSEDDRTYSSLYWYVALWKPY